MNRSFLFQAVFLFFASVGASSSSTALPQASASSSSTQSIPVVEVLVLPPPDTLLPELEKSSFHAEAYGPGKLSGKLLFTEDLDTTILPTATLDGQFMELHWFGARELVLRILLDSTQKSGSFVPLLTGVRDLAGNVFAGSLPSLLLDLAGPVIADSSLSTLLRSSSPKRSFRVSAEDPAGVTKYLWTLNGQPVGGNDQSVLKLEKLSEGRHILSVRAQDALGNIGPVATTVFIQDYTGPILPEASLQNTDGAALSSSPKRHVRVAPASDSAGVKLYRWSVDGKTAFETSVPETRLQLNEGKRRISVLAVDSLDNVGNPLEILLEQDFSAPAFDASKVRLAGGVTLLRDSLLSIEIAPEILADIDSLYWGLSPEESRGAVPNALQVLLPSEGSHVIYLQAADRAGNLSGKVQLRVDYDATSPFVTGITWPQTTTVGAKGFHARLIFSEILDTTKSLRGTFGKNSLNLRFVSPDTLALDAELGKDFMDSSIHVGVEGAVDLAGNRMDKAWTISLAADGKAPKILSRWVHTLSGKTLLPSKKMSIAIDSVSDASGVEAWLYALDSAAFTEHPATKNIELDRLADGNHLLKVKARDGAGNLGETASFSFRVDTKAPRTDSILPSNTGTIARGEFSAKIFFDEDMDSTTAVSARVDDKAMSFSWENLRTLQVAFTADSASPNGSLEVVVKHLKDLAGNSVERPVSFHVAVDTRPPVWSESSLRYATGIIRSDSLTISAENVKDDSPIARYLYRVDGGSPMKSDTSSWLLKNLAEGRHTFAVKAEDVLGNRSDAVKIDFLVDSKSPVLLSAKVHNIDSATGTLFLTLNFDENPVIVKDSVQPSFVSSSCFAKGRLSAKDSLSLYAAFTADSTMMMTDFSVELVGVSDLAGNVSEKQNMSFAFSDSNAFEMGRALAGSRAKAAEKLLLWARNQSPTREDIRRELVQIYRSRGDSLLEEQELVGLSGLRPSDRGIFQRLVELAWKRKDYAQARRFLTTLLIAEGRTEFIDFDDYITEGRPFFYFLEEGFRNPGEKAAMEIRLFTWQALEAVQQGRDEDALKHFRNAKGLDSSVDMRFNLATQLLRTGNVDAALDELRFLSADDPAALGNYAVALVRKGNESAALARYEENIELTKNPVHASNYGVLLIREGRVKEGLPYLEKSARESEDVRLDINLAYGFYSADQLDNASQVFGNIADSLAEIYPDVYFGRALCFFKVGNSQAALHSLQQAILAKPHYLDAITRLGDDLAEKGMLKEAEENYNKVLALAPENYRVKQALSGVYQGLGDEKRSRDMALKAIRTKKDKTVKDPDARVVAVMRFQNLSDSSLAWLSIAAAEAITSDMQEFSEYQMVERLHLEEAVKQLSLQQSFDESSGGDKLGKMLGASALIMGSFQGGGGSVRMDARLVDIESGKILATGTASGKIEDVGRIEREMALSLAGLAGHKEYEEMAGLISTAAQRKLAEARNYLYEGDKEKAKASSEDARKIDPNVLSVLNEAVLVDEADAKGKTLAVLPFTNITNKRADVWMIGGIQEALITDLKKIAGLYMVERSQVNKMVEEMSLSESGLIKEGSAPSVGKMLSAGVTIMGSFQVVGETVKISARMVNVETGEVHLATDIKGPKDQILELEEKLAFRIIEALNINISNYEQRRIVEKDPLALRTLKDGMQKEQDDKGFYDEIEKYKKMAGKVAGKVLIAGSVASTVLFASVAYVHYGDKQNYEAAETVAETRTTYERASTTFGLSVLTGGVTALAWTVTGGYYAWKKWFSEEPLEIEKSAGRPGSSETLAGVKK